MRLKTQRGTILTIAVSVLALMGCDGSNAVGLRLDGLPQRVKAKCPHPSELLSRGGTVADDEISMGRLGAALIDCDRRRQIAVDAYHGASVAIGPQ